MVMGHGDDCQLVESLASVGIRSFTNDFMKRNLIRSKVSDPFIYPSGMKTWAIHCLREHRATLGHFGPGLVLFIIAWRSKSLFLLASSPVKVGRNVLSAH